MTEVKVKKPMYHLGEPVEPGAVIDLLESDAAYLVGIGRVERIDVINAAETGEPIDAAIKSAAPAGRKAK